MITNSSWPISKVVVSTSSGACQSPAKFSSYARATRAGVSLRPSRSGSSPIAISNSRTAASARALSYGPRARPSSGPNETAEISLTLLSPSSFVQASWRQVQLLLQLS